MSTVAKLASDYLGEIDVVRDCDFEILRTYDARDDAHLDRGQDVIGVDAVS